MFTLLTRIIYTLKNTVKHRQQLKKIRHRTPKNLSTDNIDPQQLKQQGVHILALDFDGVLASHGEIYPNEILLNWLKKCVTIFGADNVFILSNKPLPARITYFKQHYAGVRFIAGVKKKPYPDGLEKIIQLSNAQPHTIMLLDDRLLTGALAACIAQVQVTYITQPYVNFKKRPIQESFFWLLRFLERHLV